MLRPAPLLAEQEGLAVEDGAGNTRPRNVAEEERDIAAGRERESSSCSSRGFFSEW